MRDKGLYRKPRSRTDKNFILALILTGVLLLIALSAGILCHAVSTDLDLLKNSMEGKLEQGPLEDIEGYAFMLEGMGYGFGSFSLFIFRLLLVWLPSLLGFHIFVFALAARLVDVKTAKRRLCYRILMGFSFFGQIVVFFCCFLLTAAEGWPRVAGLFGSFGTGLVIFLGMRGTYTGRLQVNSGIQS